MATFDDALAGTVGADWMQGRSVFGGLQAAIGVRAMRAVLAADDVPLRTLQVTFVAPIAAGGVRATARVLRAGRSATHVEARIGDAMVAIGVFGRARASTARVVPVRPPVVAGAPVELRHVAGESPAFLQHFRARWLRGDPPFSGATGTAHVVELGLRAGARGATECDVVALADVVPPLALSHLRAPANGSTLTWMLELVADRFDHHPLDGWRVDAELVAARDGYTSQSVMLWAPDGSPAAISRQCMLVFG